MLQFFDCLVINPSLTTLIANKSSNISDHYNTGLIIDSKRGVAFFKKPTTKGAHFWIRHFNFLVSFYFTSAENWNPCFIDSFSNIFTSPRVSV